jgi:hypothetical protein
MRGEEGFVTRPVNPTCGCTFLGCRGFSVSVCVGNVCELLFFFVCVFTGGAAGNLGAIDPQYDVAVTTAAAALDNFVVDTADGAQRCVEYLRTIGARGKFIILEEVRAACILLPLMLHYNLGLLSAPNHQSSGGCWRGAWL